MPAPRNPVVHMELHTSDPAQARAFYQGLCGWRSKHVHVASGGSPYLALELGDTLGGGIVGCATPRPLWLPYVEVAEITAATERARRLGASVLLEPREGPSGWRSVVSAAAGAEIALWQPKR
ncbi:MAG TPA: VOC family protein [Solirubrobacterales bacterium]|nr:VOC family protein [Solirubrobacterales bacterium]